ncbi:hypothetical protein GWI33_014407 [Rhynchophorus ferrugineus]|uniref:Uncharacterized protein n=1 Tax=Rhynchophorus ferrugineus TaxID=354439 RepID=A0A834I788_RHYFE|nr:hypothetical protein GWI33_014407 [Rhynchophorus ferrugineus]
MDKREFRVLIKYCFLKGKNTVESKTWLDAEFSDTVPGKSTIEDCYVIVAVDGPSFFKLQNTEEVQENWLVPKAMVAKRSGKIVNIHKD